MHIYQQYADLRQNVDRFDNKDSLWPTFTDVMAVVLMIFMLSMIAVIIRSTDLAQQLSVISYDLKQSILRSSDLEAKLTVLEEKLRGKEMEIILLGEESKVMKSNLEVKLAIITALESDKTKLKEKVIGLEEDILEKERMLLKAKDEKLEITKKMEKKIDEFNKKFSALAQVLNEKEDTILILDTKKKELELDLARQRREYTSLEDKYNKLIRPARSILGKVIATVNYSRSGNDYKILFQDVDSSKFERLYEKQLHERLRGLKDRLKDKLYVKIIIPEDSNLSVNEAWTFTKDILSKYDYYYRDRD